MRFLLVALLALWMASPAARAAEREAHVYYFWAASCSVCEAARLFLDKARAADPEIQVRDFEVEHDLGNAILFSRFYERIGMPGFRVVPLVVIGTHVVVGFDGEAERDILDHIGDCLKHGCQDIVGDLVREPSEVEQAALAPFIPPPVCARSASASLDRPSIGR